MKRLIAEFPKDTSSAGLKNIIEKNSNSSIISYMKKLLTIMVLGLFLFISPCYLVMQKTNLQNIKLNEKYH